MATQVETNTPTPLAGNGHGSDYSGFDGQFIGGSWRAGRSGRRAKDFDPFTGQAVAEIALGNQGDLDEAYQVAQRAQPSWATLLPAEREQVMLRAASIMESRKDEIISWLVHEAGSTRVKCQFEWMILHGITVEAASFCHRASGRILPIDEPGKESRAYRQPNRRHQPVEFPNLFIESLDCAGHCARELSCPKTRARYSHHGRIAARKNL
jgi:Aldehyde dehydrogenase family